MQVHVNQPPEKLSQTSIGVTDIVIKTEQRKSAPLGLYGKAPRVALQHSSLCAGDRMYRELGATCTSLAGLQEISIRSARDGSFLKTTPEVDNYFESKAFV